MNSEKNDFLLILQKLVETDLNLGDFSEKNNQYNLTGFLLRHTNNNFFNLIISNKHSIQVVFSEDCLKAYLRTIEKENLNSLNGIYF